MATHFWVNDQVVVKHCSWRPHCGKVKVLSSPRSNANRADLPLRGCYGWKILDVRFCRSNSPALVIRGVTRGGQGGTTPWAPKSPNNVSSAFFNTVHLLRKTVGSNMGGGRLTCLRPRAPSNLGTLPMIATFDHSSAFLSFACRRERKRLRTTERFLFRRLLCRPAHHGRPQPGGQQRRRPGQLFRRRRATPGHSARFAFVC